MYLKCFLYHSKKYSVLKFKCKDWNSQRETEAEKLNPQCWNLPLGKNECLCRRISLQFVSSRRCWDVLLDWRKFSSTSARSVCLKRSGDPHSSANWTVITTELLMNKHTVTCHSVFVHFLTLVFIWREVYRVCFSMQQFQNDQVTPAATFCGFFLLASSAKQLFWV